MEVYAQSGTAGSHLQFNLKAREAAILWLFRWNWWWFLVLSHGDILCWSSGRHRSIQFSVRSWEILQFRRLTAMLLVVRLELKIRTGQVGQG